MLIESSETVDVDMCCDCRHESAIVESSIGFGNEARDVENFNPPFVSSFRDKNQSSCNLHTCNHPPDLLLRRAFQAEIHPYQGEP